MAGTGPDSAGPYAHEKPTKMGNVVGTPKPAIPRLELHVSTRVHRDATDRDALGLSRVLLTTDDPLGGSKVLLAVEGLKPVQVDVFTLLANAPRMARLLARIVELDASSRQTIGSLASAVGEARAMVDALPFEVTP